MKKLIWLFLCFSLKIQADTIRVAVLDTGKSSDPTIKYCKEGHRDFTGKGMMDNHGHGTNIAKLIQREAGNSDFCIISLKYYDPNRNNLISLEAAILQAIALDVDIINISGGGNTYSRSEAVLIQIALNKGIAIFAAAGNDGVDFSQKCSYYPACYDDRIVAVGCMDEHYVPCEYSNFGGKIKIVRIGKNQLGMTGTSQATAVTTGRYVKFLNDKKIK